LEWNAIEELRRLHTPPDVLLPVSKNKRADEVIVFPAASGVAAFRPTESLERLIKNQAGANPATCIAALDDLFRGLEPFYISGPGAAHPANSRELLSWEQAFPTLARSSNVKKVTDAAQRMWSDVQWDSDREFELTWTGLPPRRLPNPFLALGARLQELTGRVMLSRIHGDLNLTNIIVSLRGDRQVHRAFIIDITNCKSGRIQAIDFARIEVEIWRELLDEFYDDTENALSEFVTLRDFLDGRIQRPPTDLMNTQRSLLEIVDHLRSNAADYLKGKVT
jgi:hypothetical protein